MSRFDGFPYQQILRMVADPGRRGIGYLQRVWVPLTNANEPFLWRSRSWLLRGLVWGLLSSWLALMCYGAFGSGPRGIVPLLPLIGLFLVAPICSGLARIYRMAARHSRVRVSTDAFADGVGACGNLNRGVVEAARAALSHIYGIPAEIIVPGDSESSLRKFLGAHVPYAFEVVLGARLIMGDQFCTDDPGVDEVLQKVHDEANTVADIVRIMNGAYGRKVSGKGGAPGTPEGGECAMVKLAEKCERGPDGAVARRYTLGHWIISETRNISGTWTTSFYGYDGHNSVWFQTSTSGTVTDNYTFDAFGIKIAGAGSTPNQILYSGEYLDPGTGNYALRNRIYRQNTGTFLAADTTPAQLPYVYTSDNPVMFDDPTGRFFSMILSNFIYGREVHEAIGVNFLKTYGRAPKAYSNARIARILKIHGTFWDRWRPDLVEMAGNAVYEIKSMNTGWAIGEAELQGYIAILDNFDTEHRSWHAGNDYIPPEIVPIEDAPPGTFAIVSPPEAGVILYQVVSMSLAVAEVTAFATADRFVDFFPVDEVRQNHAEKVARRVVKHHRVV